MTTAQLIVLVVLLAGAVCVAGLLAWRWAVERSALAEARARLEADSAMRQSLAADLHTARQELGSARALAAQLGQRIATDQEKLEGLAAVHRLELDKAQELAQAKIDSAGALMAQLRQDREGMDRQLRESFAKLSGDALRASQEQLIAVAEQKFAAARADADKDLAARQVAVERLVGPIAQTLSKADEQIRELEKERQRAYAGLREQMTAVNQVSAELRRETGNLVRALRDPKVRGTYGEVQLRRVAELAGMREYCDFVEQDHRRDEDGAALRPDMIVRLPNGRELVVDAKANLKPYLDALEATTEQEREQSLDRFAEGIARQAEQLAGKRYWKQYQGSPEQTVMFVPADQFLDAALARRPGLIEEAAQRRVVFATPSTLIALLRAVAVGFAELRVTEHAREIQGLGKELSERVAKVAELVGDLGEQLGRTNKKYNELVGSWDTRLGVTLRRFQELADPASEPRAPELLEVVPRRLAAAQVVAIPPGSEAQSAGGT
ncbi:MAG: DNA recombination protein RmuC [Planctomyces sp.]|nr:DNA recombination protein RmuC [Planctomyces sp.]